MDPEEVNGTYAARKVSAKTQNYDEEEDDDEEGEYEEGDLEEGVDPQGGM